MTRHLTEIEVGAFALALGADPKMMEALDAAPGWRGNLASLLESQIDRITDDLSATEAEVQAVQKYCNGVTKQVIRILGTAKPAGVVSARLVSRSLRGTEMAFHHVAPLVSFEDGRDLVVDYWPTRDLKTPEVATLEEWLGRLYVLIEG